MQKNKLFSMLVSISVIIGLFFLGRYFYLKATAGPKKVERTLAIIKPDAVAAKNSGKIIDKIEQEGFTILALKKMTLTKELAEKFYDVHKDRIFFHELVDFMTSGPIIVMVLEKENAIKEWRDLLGNTDPKKAREGTLRNLYGINISKNGLHGSDGPETAKIETSFFFADLK